MISKNELEALGIEDKRKFNYFRVENSLIDSGLLTNVYQISVYVLFCRYANNLGYCYPSIETMCKQLGISKNKLIKTIRELEELKIIKKITRKKGKVNLVNIYTISGIPSEINSSQDEQEVVHDMNEGSSQEGHYKELDINNYSINNKEKDSELANIENIKKRILIIARENHYNIGKVVMDLSSIKNLSDVKLYEKRIINKELRF